MLEVFDEEQMADHLQYNAYILKALSKLTFLHYKLMYCLE
jgi:hypothetical protein